VKPSAKKKFSLTARETDVARQLQIGAPRKIMAEHLSISVFTVDKHVRRIRKKIDAPSTREAVAVLGHYSF